jgi:hypothetical protein
MRILVWSRVVDLTVFCMNCWRLIRADDFVDDPDAGELDATELCVACVLDAIAGLEDGRE